MEELSEYIPPPFGQSKIEDFVILYHSYLSEKKLKKNDDSDME